MLTLGRVCYEFSLVSQIELVREFEKDKHKVALYIAESMVQHVGLELFGLTNIVAHTTGWWNHLYGVILASVVVTAIKSGIERKHVYSDDLLILFKDKTFIAEYQHVLKTLVEFPLETMVKDMKNAERLFALRLYDQHTQCNECGL